MTTTLSPAHTSWELPTVCGPLTVTSGTITADTVEVYLTSQAHALALALAELGYTPAAVHAAGHDPISSGGHYFAYDPTDPGMGIDILGRRPVREIVTTTPGVGEVYTGHDDVLVATHSPVDAGMLEYALPDAPHMPAARSTALSVLAAMPGAVAA